MIKEFEDGRVQIELDTDRDPFGWISWKGTDVCMTIKCTKCGFTGHVDAEGAYFVRCAVCGQMYRVLGFVILQAVDTLPEWMGEDGERIADSGIEKEEIEEAKQDYER